MTTSPSTTRVFVMYTLGYALAIAALLLDIRYGRAIFALIGLASSLAMTTHLLYRVARAMAFSPAAAHLRTAPMRAGRQRVAA